MANNYLNFSEVLTDLDKEDVEWLEEQLNFFGRYHDECAAHDLDFEDHPNFAEAEHRYNMYNMEWDEEGFDFTWKFELADSGEKGKRQLWVYSDDSGNVEQIATLMHEFLKARQPDGCFHLSYSLSCSRPRVGEFGGGAFFATAEGIEWMETYSWIDSRRRAFKNNSKHPYRSSNG